MKTPPDLPSEPSIEVLLSRARGGDEGALEALFQHARPRLRTLAKKRIGRSGRGLVGPSDLAQEAALRAAHGFSTFNGTSAAAWFAWLKTILERVDDQLRRDAKRKKRDIPIIAGTHEDEALDVPAPEKSPSQAAALEEEWRHVYACIYKLPERQREAIVLHHLKDLSVAEIAERFGVTQTAISGRLQRGFAALQAGVTEGRAPLAEADETVAAAIQEYLLRRDAGERLDPEVFAAEHPTCAEALSTMLRWAARIEALRPTSTERKRRE